MVMTTTPPATSPRPSNISSIRATKRKLDDAFLNLDNAVHPLDSSQPPPQKKSHTLRTLYSTLAKYGIKSKETRPESDVPPELPTSKSMPHFSAILARAASRTRKALQLPGSASTLAPPLPPTAEYRPSSTPSFLSRLATFKLATYSHKPSAIDAVAAAKCGWINDGKDRLVCGLCKGSWVVAGREGLSKDAANALVEKQRVSLVQMHKDGCPWKTQQCDPSIYRIPLSTPSAMVRDIKTNAIVLDHFLTGVKVKHPLTSTQFTSLVSTVRSFEPLSQTDTQPDDGDVFLDTRPPALPEPSDTSILVSVFGWSVVTASEQEPHRKVSLSRAGSVAPSTPRASSSRATSVRPMTPNKGSGDMQEPPSTPPRAEHHTPFTTPIHVPSTPFTFRLPAHSTPKRDATLLQCSLCQRRLGLWAFTPQSQPVNETALFTPRPNTPDHTDASDALARPTEDSDSVLMPPPPTTVPSHVKQGIQRQLDLLKEHRSFCPYVVRSTVIPSLPVPGISSTTSVNRGHLRTSSSVTSLSQFDGTLEGWRAVVVIILRYGAGQRKRTGLDLGEAQMDEQDSIEVNGVKAMVEGVKTHGGKDLLRYVKGLLS